jgi:hypothetical protein
MWQYGIDPWNADCIHDMSGGLFSFEKQADGHGDDFAGGFANVCSP